ncbi:hypothetical protein COY87_04705 [Candidatus Roizmanbacteria bacterium CG_4_10_14_0_8_um_filter_33_9]|uniref:Uncharacterized protein n=1 Tax=Candidatus Roizmanbacteria bacterium CG_4_10_14_0_8_um_filter_33_9 TaxID=1974826 RepID=A0A2M7QHB9_9BACT|nr:MAG: hypothetical protein COY87_04705 [Candidatus Roizmanbacteria bacterium CG_4_10_14_0_8_um_filter_33_9]
MAKKTGSFLDDTIEQLEQLGKSTVKQTAASLKQTFSPTSLFEHVTGQTSENSNQKMEQLKKDKNSTPLDFAKLQENYAGQDKQKTDVLRNRFFQIVKNEDEKLLQKKKQEEQQKQQQLLYEEQEKERKKQQQKQQNAPGEATGKQKGRLGQARKKAHVPDPVEMKPNSGKN